MNNYKSILILIIIFGFILPGRCQVNFPPYIIEDETFYLSEHSNVFQSHQPIISPGSPTKPVNVYGDAVIKYISDESVTLTAGFQASNFIEGDFEAYINDTGDPDVSVVIYHPVQTPGEVGIFDRFEIGISLPPSIEQQIDDFLNDLTNNKPIINPYDYEQIDISAIYTHTNTSTQKKRYGFYYKNYARNPSNTGWDLIHPIFNGRKYNWRVRFTPELLGDWTCTLFIDIPALPEQEQIIISNLHFTCVDSDKKDFLSIGPDGLYLWHEYSQEYEFLSGLNIMWPEADPPPKFTPTSLDEQQGYVEELASYGGNHIGTALINSWGWRGSCPIASFGIEWERLGVYDTIIPYDTGEVANNRQINAWELDRRFFYCEDNDIYQKFSLITHDDFYAFDLTSWDWNPYQIQIEGVNDVVDFFTNSAAKTTFKKKLRYIVARWGYSTSIAYYDIIYEINAAISNNYDEESRDWFFEMSEFLKSIDENHLISGAYGSIPNDHIFQCPNNNCFSDIVAFHNYENSRLANKWRQELPNSKWSPGETNLYDRPSVLNEIGTDTNADGCSHLPFHNAIWSTAFTRNLGTLYWNWFQVYEKGSVEQIGPLQTFFKDYVSLYGIKDYYYDWDWAINERRHRYEIFEMRKYDGSIAYGWLHHIGHYWYNVDSESCSGLPEPQKDDPWGCCNYDKDRNVTIQGLKKNKEYYLEYYFTGKSDPNPSMNWQLSYYKTDVKETTNGGNLSFKPKDKLQYARDNGYYQDLAMVIRESDIKEIITTTFDTLDCYLDTIYSTGIYEDDFDTLYNYYWDFGNGQTSYEAWPKHSYDSAGNYTIKLFVYDSTILIDTLITFLTVLNCDTADESLKNNGDNNFTEPEFFDTKNVERYHLNIFPNPTGGILHVQIERELNSEPYNVLLYDVYGRQVYALYDLKPDRITIDLSNFTGGLYYIKVICQEIIKTEKFILMK